MKIKTLFVSALLLCLAFGASAAETGEYFFRNNISNETRLTEMHMLGAHDAFTSSLNTGSAVDAAGVKLGDSGSKAAQYDFLWSMAVASSKAQSADVDTLLNSGVRYFDVRLSRYINGGEFYTTHGRISDQFTGEGGIARKISAWAEAHPGEIIILDFQSLFDIQTDNGGATQQSWTDLMSKLTYDGIVKYVYTSNGSLSNLTYGSLTDNGSRAAIVLFGQVTGSWADSRYINRRDEDGYMRSLWTETTSFDSMYSKLSAEIDNLLTNSDSYYYKLRVMQAQTTKSPLIGMADENNIKMLTDENYSEWSELLPILMVDNATSDSGNFNALALDMLARKNREYTDGIYSQTSGSVTLAGSNRNVPLGTKFTALQDGSSLTLSLGGEDIGGEMTLIIKSNGKKQRLYSGETLLGETAPNGLLTAKISSLGGFTLTDTDESIAFTATRPLLWYTFTGENALADSSGNGLSASKEGNPSTGDGCAVISTGNVLRLPSGLTSHMKSYTASAWVYSTSSTNNSRLFDICRHQRASVFAHAASNKTSSGLKNSTTVSADGSGLALNKWTHIAVSYSGGTLTLYLNGSKASTAYSSDPAPDTLNDYFNPNGSFIGRTSWYAFNENPNDNPDMNARIADFRIYDSALSPAEISRLARTPKLRFVDILTGTQLQSAEAIDVPTAYSGASAPDKIGEYTLVRIDNISDMAGESEAVAYYTLAESLTVDKTADGIEATLIFNKARANVRLILAAYASDGSVRVASAPLPTEKPTLPLALNDGEAYKAFLWEEGLLRPIKLLTD